MMERLNPKKTMKGIAEEKDYVQESLDALRNDPEVYAFISNTLKLSQRAVKENLADLLDYQDDLNYCKTCPGLKRCSKAIPHYCMRLEYRGGVMYRHIDPCKLQQEKEDFLNRYIVRDFPISYMNATLLNVEESVSTREIVIKKMSLRAKGESDKWLYLTGKRGSGKTYLLVAFANSFSMKRAPVAFCDSSKLIEKLKNMIINDKDGFAELMNQLSSCPLLILDEFGNEFKNELTFSTILFPLLNERAKRKLVTAFASDFSIDDIGSMYQDKVGRPRARQLTELLREYCKKENDVTGVAIH